MSTRQHSGATVHPDDTLDLPIVTTAQQRRAAGVTVCAHATDLDDARYLLDALGLRDAAVMSA